MSDDQKRADDGERRLIEDYLPIRVLSVEAAREKTPQKGYISTLHLWWARRPLVAARAAVYGVLVPTARFVPPNGSDSKATSLGRANAAKFVERLCQYPGSPSIISEAEEHILNAHAQRLSRETSREVTVDDVRQGRAPRPRVLDMFAGGGSIPLEALRLGCESYAIELNPVAHIVELCTLVYPQKYGKPDPNAKGSAKDGKWAGIAAEVKHWGEWVLEKVRVSIGDLYPQIIDPDRKTEPPLHQASLPASSREKPSTRNLIPVAYLWSRTVRCKNASCGATVPLVKQTWLRKKKGDLVALRIVVPKNGKRAHFVVVRSATESGLGIDPTTGSKGGNATCAFCGTVADTEYVKSEGKNGGLGQQLMAVACTRPGAREKIYVGEQDASHAIPSEDLISQRIQELCHKTGLTVPTEPIISDAKNSCWTPLYGLKTFGDIFTRRQLLCLLSFVAATHDAEKAMDDIEGERRKAVVTILAAMLDRLADFSSSLCVWNCVEGERTAHTFGRQALPMTWDFSESAPFNEESASWPVALERVIPAIAGINFFNPGTVMRGSATHTSLPAASVDAIVTDPPYYDNVPYSNISDFFYVWLRRTVGHLYPEHFATELTPKKQEAVADATRHRGDKEEAKRAYEKMMADAFHEANRVLKPSAPLVLVYAHKTTTGWATLVDALRTAGFTVTEAWPLDTEKPGRLRAQESAALASSIFLIARKRDGDTIGSYEEHVRPALEKIVRERVETLWEMGVSGADLVIAAVGAGLRAFTRFARVEYANGEEVPSSRFLAEVEGVVLETLLQKIFGVSRLGVAAVDAASRFYVLWRYTYKSPEIDAGEAIVFTYSQRVELDGQNGMSTGAKPLVEKKKGKYRLLDYTERGDDPKLGLPAEDGTSAPLIDTLHRLLWLMENEPRKIAKFLDDARPDAERLRLCAQALAGAGLKGKSEEEAKALVLTTAPEQAALAKLTANWRPLIEQRVGAYDIKGQKRMAFDKGEA
jgi:putative DNA methylase